MGERLRLNIEMEGGDREKQRIRNSMTEMEKVAVVWKSVTTNTGNDERVTGGLGVT